MAQDKCAQCGTPLTLEGSNKLCSVCGSNQRAPVAADQTTGNDKADAAKELARRHYELEAGVTQILRFTDKAEAPVARAEPIKLLEVNENTVEAGVMPLHFAPAPASGIPYSSIIIEVTPSEFKKILAHELELPAGWEISEEIPRPSAHTEGG